MIKGTYPSPKELEELYAKRDTAVALLGDKGRIEVVDLESLDYQGRCKVASEHWPICSESARRALLNDAHHFVRSCASLAA